MIKQIVQSYLYSIFKQNKNALSMLDHLRFFAATLVIYHHFQGGTLMPKSISSAFDVIKVWLSGGASGVSLFLVLSGFLFCVISDRGNKEIRYFGFMKNRILRIFPLLVFIFFIVLAVGRKDSTPMDILRLLTLQLNTGNPRTGWGHDIFPIGPIWTIAVEFQFYLIFPFLILFTKKMGVRYLISLSVLMVLVKYIIVALNGFSIYSNLYHTIIGRLDQFLVGILLGFIYLGIKDRDIKIPTASSLMLLLTSLAFATIFMYYRAWGFGWFIPLSFLVEAIIWGGVIFSYLSLSIKIPKKVDIALAYLGGLSYSMYLLHLPVGLSLQKLLSLRPDSTTEAVLQVSYIILPATIALAFMTYTCIEKPFLSLRKNYTS